MQIIGAIKGQDGLHYIGYDDGEIYFFNPVSETWVVIDTHYTNPDNTNMEPETVRSLSKICPNFIKLNGDILIITKISEFSIIMSGENGVEYFDLNEVVDPEEEEAILELMKVGE